MTRRGAAGQPARQPESNAKSVAVAADSSYDASPGTAVFGAGDDTAADLLAPGDDTATHSDPLQAARDELSTICGQINDGHRRLIGLMRHVLADDLWAGAGIKSPEHWLTAFAGLTWSSAHDVVRIASRADDLPAMTSLIDDGRLTLGQAAVVAKYTPTGHDDDVAEFASYATVTQLRRTLTRYEFNVEKSAAATESPVADDPAHEAAGPASPAAETSTAESPAADGCLHNGEPGEAHRPDDATATTSAHLPSDTIDDPAAADLVDSVVNAALARAPGLFDPATAPPQLEMRYAAGRFHLTYHAPADIGALVEQAVLEAKDALFRVRDPRPEAASETAGRGDQIAAEPADAGIPTAPGTAGTGGPATPDSARVNHRSGRPRGQRASLGEAMTLLAQRSLDSGAPPGSSRSRRYRVYLHLDIDGNAWLNKGAAIPPALRNRMTCDGVVQPIWESDGRPVSVGRAQRIVPERTRRIIEDRDRGCRFPGCLTLHHLECHHLDHWIDGGPTDDDRLLMLCQFHHHEHHCGTFTMVGDPSRPNGVIFTARDGATIGPMRPAYGETPFRAKEFVSYAGPTNDTLHLAMVRFDPNRRAHPSSTERPPGDDDADPPAAS
ncbi:hypothetical protein HJ588_09490 [Flexivirga sp. ID2601S]|uniref:HNH nuclease domain-containing protein n=1 Tax=Flexivirga aerilata TaxID=1656889 RepID=A0A849ARY0_9MICO|nr:hypothetical protein [Flexivirga aerilata]NNG39502.1 hypothetical protein [Flexivirga aerilata]